MATTPGSDNTESGGYLDRPYTSSGAPGMGQIASQPGSEGSGLDRPYTSYGATGEADGDPTDIDGAGGVTTNYPHDDANVNDKNSQGRRPNSMGTVPDYATLDAPYSVTDPLYTSGYDHDPQRPNQVKGTRSDTQTPTPNPGVINRGYVDSDAPVLSARNLAGVRQKLGNRGDGSRQKNPPSPGV
jgi:hypothetical protein